VSKHLKVLEHAGLVARRRAGRTHHLSVRLEPLRQAASWIEDQRRFWEQSLDRLARQLDDLEPETRHDHKGRDQER
jgi:DNA-binding transcriptional ArsR family regulator